MSTQPSPGPEDQARTRTTLRIAGVALLLVALFLFGSGALDVLSASSDSSGSGPSKFGMLFVGLLLFAPAGLCLQAGFAGSRARAAATDPVPGPAADPAGGQVIAGVGPTADDVPPPPPGTPVGTGPRCPACGVPSQAGAATCDWCGASLAG